MTMTGQPSTHIKPTPKSDVIDEDKHQGLIVTKNSSYDDDGTTQHLPPCNIS